ncbi:hypothetical protein Hdeb2414_s0024g00647691 [Helianthus debilis subsp. tardiflorus]
MGLNKTDAGLKGNQEKVVRTGGPTSGYSQSGSNLKQASPVHSDLYAGHVVLDQTLGSVKAAGPSAPSYNSGPTVLEPMLKSKVGSPVKAQKIYGKSGFYDVSKNSFVSQSGPTCNTTNSFGTLRDEEECFDTDLGMWEHEIEMVKKFVETSTRPKIEDYSAWFKNTRKYYDSLTKVNGDEAEVESETDEMARFMKIGSKF